MHRRAFTFVGVAEILGALLLLFLAARLPRPAQVASGFSATEQVLESGIGQIEILRVELQSLPRDDMKKIAGQMRSLADEAKRASDAAAIDRETLALTRDGLRAIADTLEMSTAAGPGAAESLAAGLGEAADFLEGKVLPAAQDAALEIDTLRAVIEKERTNIEKFLRDTPIDLGGPMRQMEAAMADSQAVLGIAEKTLDREAIDAIVKALDNYRELTIEAASYPDRLADRGIPGTSIRIWPDGKEVAAKIRSGADAIEAVKKKLVQVASDIPKLQEAVAKSRGMLENARTAIGVMLKQEKEIQASLAKLREGTLVAVTALPDTLGHVSDALKQTQRLEQVVTALRAAHDAAEAARKHWGTVEVASMQTAAMLRTAAANLDRVLQQPEHYETIMRQYGSTAQHYLVKLATSAERADEYIELQDRELEKMAGGVEQLAAVLPAYSSAAVAVTQTVLAGAVVLALILLAHGAFLIIKEFGISRLMECWSSIVRQVTKRPSSK